MFSIFFGEIQMLLQEGNKDAVEHMRKMDNVNGQMECAHGSTYRPHIGIADGMPIGQAQACRYSK